MRRRAVLIAVGVAAVASGAGVLSVGHSSTTSVGADASLAATRTVAVETRDLVEREELEGTLGYGERSDVSLGAQGILTSLPAEGSIVDRGGVVAEVDGRSVRLMFGTRPLWRPLGAGVSDGPDVRQLEENLVALGHATTASLVVDDEWTAATTTAVKRWQKAIGVDQSGTVGPGDLVILPGAARVAERKATVGAPAASGPVLSVTGTEKVVTVDLDASRRDLLPVGTAVDVELPDGKKIDATVRWVSSVVTPPADDTPGAKATVEVVIALPAGVDVAFDSSPVDVLVAAKKAEGALTVPVDALLALAEGGYAVERVRNGATKLVSVEIGMFADGYVQVTGDVTTDDKVTVPR